jgi:hypothetical protein
MYAAENPIKGLQLSKSYYFQIIKPIIESTVIGPSYAAGLIGYGSDVLGNDDHFSIDHEWGPRCIIFLPEKLIHHKNSLFDKLNTLIPAEFMKYPTRFVDSGVDGINVLSSSTDGNVNIPITICRSFFCDMIEMLKPKREVDWLYIPEQRLLEIVSGEIFYDGFGEITELRKFYRYYPESVWRFRLAYTWQSLGWSIDARLCAERGDILSAKHCISSSINKIIKLIFLLNKRYAPGYFKWIHKEFTKLPYLADELGKMIENCYTATDLKSASNLLIAICRKLIDFQSDFLKLPQPEVERQIPFSRGFYDIDFQSTANALHGSIEGELGKVKLYGAVDQWMVNEDMLLNLNHELAKIRFYDEG